MWWNCVTCGRSDFLSQRSLTQHRRNSKECIALRERQLGVGTTDPREGFASVGSNTFYKKQKVSKDRYVSVHHQYDEEEQSSVDKIEAAMDDEDDSECNIDLPPPFLYDSDNNSEGPDASILDNFRKYVENNPKNEKHRRAFERKYIRAIRIMSILRKTDASLSTYKSVMEWHFHESGELRPYAPLSQTPEYISHERLFTKLKARYNIQEESIKVMDVVLPSSSAKVRIVKSDFKACLVSLLTDPRIMDDDYLFYKDNPTKSPPKNQNNLKFVSDLHTSRAYIDTYRRVVKNPGKQVLLPIIFYIDAASTGQFANLPIYALKFTLGIFNKAARARPHMWRTLGYVPVILPDESKGKRTLQESGHLDAPMHNMNLVDGEGEVDDNSPVKAQDYHTILATIMQEFQEFQHQGFVWDLPYRGKLWSGLEFIPYVHFVKCDTDEADKLCGSFTSRGKKVQQLCRYCHCPTDDSDDPDVNITLKTVEEIADLVKNGDIAGLKKLAQQPINNVWYPICFGSHNAQGIHGACPLELLHQMYLGLFQYIRDCFYANLGKTGKMVKDINGLATEIGNLFQRQSDRDMPKTRFGNGIQQGRHMATEYPGILLIVLAMLVTRSGKEIVSKLKNGTLAKKEGIKDWILLLETLLMWDMWLKSDQMAIKHVVRAKKKHRYIMYLIRKVGNRTEGMGLKIMKFHGIVHMADDILNFGVPMLFDTGSDESGHKLSKKEAKRTQKNKVRFDHQVATRLEEAHCLDIAGREIATGIAPWMYYTRSTAPFPPPEDDTDDRNTVGGSNFTLHKKKNGQEGVEYVCLSQIKGAQKMIIEEDFVDFIKQLYDEVGKYIVEPNVRSQYKDGRGNIFRGTNLYSGGVWRDWVIIDWGGSDGVLPAKIWGFVDLKHLPRNNDLEFGGLKRLKPSIYAIVENAKFPKIAGWKSEIFVPVEKEYKRQAGNRPKLVFYLADVADFHSTAVVIPNVGGKINHYLMVKPRSDWKTMFESWLERPFEKYPKFPKEEAQPKNYDENPE